jgi:hypothetical protein
VGSYQCEHIHRSVVIIGSLRVTSEITEMVSRQGDWSKWHSDDQLIRLSYRIDQTHYKLQLSESQLQAHAGNTSHGICESEGVTPQPA